MARVAVILNSKARREQAARWCMSAPLNTRVEFKETKRSLPQNAMMWAALTDIARQVQWHGLRLSADDWKLVFMSSLNQEMRLVPNLDGTGFVNLGRSSSDLSKAEMTDLIELIFAFGAKHDVKFGDEREAEGANNAPAVAA